MANITKLNIELGHTIEEWNEKYKDNENLWDFSVEDVLGGAIEPDNEQVFWFIDGRLYEVDA